MVYYISLLQNIASAKYAVVAELADAHGSGPCEVTLMQVQVLFPAPKDSSEMESLFIDFINKKINNVINSNIKEEYQLERDIV